MSKSPPLRFSSSKNWISRTLRLEKAVTLRRRWAGFSPGFVAEEMNTTRSWGWKKNDITNRFRILEKNIRISWGDVFSKKKTPFALPKKKDKTRFWLKNNCRFFKLKFHLIYHSKCHGCVFCFFLVNLLPGSLTVRPWKFAESQKEAGSCSSPIIFSGVNSLLVSGRVFSRCMNCHHWGVYIIPKPPVTLAVYTSPCIKNCPKLPKCLFCWDLLV